MRGFTRLSWTQRDLNLRPLACEASALDQLSYASKQIPNIGRVGENFNSGCVFTYFFHLLVGISVREIASSAARDVVHGLSVLEVDAPQ